MTLKRIKRLTKDEQKILNDRIKKMCNDELFKLECSSAKRTITKDITSDAVKNIIHQMFTYTGTRLEHGEFSNTDLSVIWSYIWKKVEREVKRQIKW